MSAYRKGNIFIISAASSHGQNHAGVVLLANITVCAFPYRTRRVRRVKREVNGVHYHFVSKEEFESLIAQEAFLNTQTCSATIAAQALEGVNALAAAGYDDFWKSTFRRGAGSQRAAGSRRHLYPPPSSMCLLHV